MIERTEEGARTRHETTSAANDGCVRTDPWEARIGGELALTCSYAEAGDRSHARRHAISGWRGSFAGDSFAWVAPPVLNSTRGSPPRCARALGILRLRRLRAHRQCRVGAAGDAAVRDLGAPARAA